MYIIDETKTFNSPLTQAPQDPALNCNELREQIQQIPRGPISSLQETRVTRE